MRILAGYLGGRNIKTITGPGCRPAMGKVRGALFSMLEARGVVWQSCRVLDLYAGSGSVGFEALSRGAPFAVFVEKDANMVKCLAQNVEKLGLNDGRCRIVGKDVAHYLRKCTDTPFDVIFIDPPYGQGLLAPTLRSLQYGEFMNKNAMIAAEIENALTLPETGDSLEKIVDRSYGQTRIAIWTTPENK